MAKVLLYYAHPGHRHSHANKAMFNAAQKVDEITVVDLYAEYPRFGIRIDFEQQRLLDHDVIVFQYPMFWYSCPSLIKEWLDLVLEHGFAYGEGGDRLAGKAMMVAVTAAGSDEAYSPAGYQHYPMQTFLTPMERTAGLCKMTYLPPYVLYSSLKAPTTGDVIPHAEGYVALLEALRDDRFDTDRATGLDVMTHDTLPIRQEA